MFYMIPGFQGLTAFVLAHNGSSLWNPHKHEKVAIYAVNQRISNGCRIAEIAKQWSNSWYQSGAKGLNAFVLAHNGSSLWNPNE